MAHLYGLTEDEFSYILTTFPLVADSVKSAALQAYRDVEKGWISNKDKECPLKVKGDWL